MRIVNIYLINGSPPPLLESRQLLHLVACMVVITAYVLDVTETVWHYILSDSFQMKSYQIPHQPLFFLTDEKHLTPRDFMLWIEHVTYMYMCTCLN